MSKNSTVGNRHGSAAVTTPNDTDILIERDFDAPAALLWRTWTEPELVKRWWGFETGVWQVCEMDVRVGGTWRWVVIDRDMEVGFHGEYRELDAPRRLVSTEIYEGAPDSVGVNTITLEEHDGVTTLRTVVHYESKEVRDAVIESGMEGGLQVSYDRMEDLVRELGS
jgi:uncharacterized protein YndB with AHSA1/START domain